MYIHKPTVEAQYFVSLYFVFLDHFINIKRQETLKTQSIMSLRAGIIVFSDTFYNAGRYREYQTRQI